MMLRSFWVVLLVTFSTFFHFSYGQNLDSIQAAQWRMEGLKRMYMPDSALLWHQKSVHQFKKLSLQDSYYESLYYEIVTRYLVGEDGQQLIDTLSRHMINAENSSGRYSVGTGFMSYGLGWIYNQLQDYEKSALAYDDCYTIRFKVYGEQHPLTLKTLSSVGVIYNISGDYLNAEKYLKKSANALNSIYGRDYPEAIGADMSLAYFYNNTGQYEEAISIGLEKLAFLSQNPTAFVDDISRVYGLLTNAFNNAEQNQKALEVSYQYYQFIEKYNSTSKSDWARIYNNLGRLYEIENLFDSASFYLQKSLLIKEKNKHLFSVLELANAYANLGVLSGKQANLKQALSFFNEADKLLMASYHPLHPELVRINQLRAAAYYRNAQYREALVYVNKTIQSTRMDLVDLKDLSETPKIDFYNSYANLIDALQLKGLILSNGFNNDQQALELYTQAKQIVLNRMQEHADRNELLQDIADLRKFFEQEILIRIRLKESQSEETLFANIEGAKSIMLRALVDEKDLVKSNASLQNINQEQSHIRKELVKFRAFYEEDQLSQTPNKKAQLSWMQEIRNYTNKLDSLKRLFDQENTNWGAKGNLENELARIKPLLTNDELMLNYLFTDTLAFVMVTSKLGSELISLGATHDIRNLANDFSEQLKKNHSFNSLLSSQLFNALFKGIDLVGINKLVIIPDEFLWSLPIESLVINNESGELLIQKATISLLPSASFYKRKSAQEFTDKVLAFAPVFDLDTQVLLANSRLNLGPLKFTEEEVNAIGDFFSLKSFVRNLANEFNFKQEKDSYSVVHLASHAVVNARNPGLSYIQLYADSTHDEDGKLYTYELMNTQLKARLMVLSACQTGVGQFVKGDGVWGMSSVLLQSGTQNLIVSLDEINDQSTATIIAYFYENLYEGLTLGESLRQAKLKYLASADSKGQNPYYWSNLVLIGNADEIFAPSLIQKYKWWLLIGLLLASLGLWVGIKRNKH